ncbi:MAG: 30S ribosome-binding factor RbfA [Rikenellaceae bacterium]
MNNNTESTRQQKISKQIQRDIAEIIQRDFIETFRGTLITVTAVRVSPDFGYAKIYFSIFPFDRSEQTMALLKEKNWAIRKALGSRIKSQIKSIPEIEFFLDDSLEYIENIDRAMNR